MQSDPRQTQTPTSPVQPTGFFSGVQIRPVIAGVMVDYISTYVAMYAYFFLYLAKGLSKEGEVSPDAITQYMTTTEGLLTGFAIGAACTALGGFIAGRMARNLEIKHGAFVGLGSLIVSFIELSMQEEITPMPEWFRFLSVVSIIPAGALGGYFAEFFKGSGASTPTVGGHRPGS